MRSILAAASFLVLAACGSEGQLTGGKDFGQVGDTDDGGGGNDTGETTPWWPGTDTPPEFDTNDTGWTWTPGGGTGSGGTGSGGTGSGGTGSGGTGSGGTGSGGTGSGGTGSGGTGSGGTGSGGTGSGGTGSGGTGSGGTGSGGTGSGGTGSGGTGSGGTATGGTPTTDQELCERAAGLAGYLDAWQTAGDGRVYYCHSSSGNYTFVESDISSCLPHLNHNFDVFPSTGCDT